MFHVGQKVCCVDDKRREGRFAWRGDLPVRGRVYVVRWAGRYKRERSGHEYDGLRLQGIVRPGAKDSPFASDRFRLVAERKTDISIFTAMLNPAPSKVTERVR